MWELIYLSMQDIISAIKRIQNGNLYSNQQQRSQYQQLFVCRTKYFARWV